MAKDFDAHKWFRNQYLNENSNIEKNEALDKAMLLLEQVGYDVNDKIYKMLELEKKKIENE
jgi:hypothetical protein